MALAAKPHVRFQVEKNIQLEQLEGLLKRIVEAQPGGCRTCGLAGFDFSIVVDPGPAFARKLEGVPGVSGMTVGF